VNAKRSVPSTRSCWSTISGADRSTSSPSTPQRMMAMICWKSSVWSRASIVSSEIDSSAGLRTLKRFSVVGRRLEPAVRNRSASRRVIFEVKSRSSIGTWACPSCKWVIWPIGSSMGAMRKRPLHRPCSRRASSVRFDRCWSLGSPVESVLESRPFRPSWPEMGRSFSTRTRWFVRCRRQANVCSI